MKHSVIRNVRAAIVALMLIQCLFVAAPAFAQTGITVVGGLGPGLGGSINPFDSAFQERLKIAELKRQAELANANAAAIYLRTAQDWIANSLREREAGRIYNPIADPPLAIHVDSKGVQTTGPDTVAQKPVLPPPSGVPSTGTIANPNAPPDRIDTITTGLAAMYDLIAKIANDVAALKAKLGVQ